MLIGTRLDHCGRSRSIRVHGSGTGTCLLGIFNPAIHRSQRPSQQGRGVVCLLEDASTSGLSVFINKSTMNLAVKPCELWTVVRWGWSGRNLGSLGLERDYGKRATRFLEAATNTRKQSTETLTALCLHWSFRKTSLTTLQKNVHFVRLLEKTRRKEDLRNHSRKRTFGGGSSPEDIQVTWPPVSLAPGGLQTTRVTLWR